MRVIVACRLSKLNDGSTGLDTQEAETVRWAQNQGHEVVEVVRDAVSGAKAILARRRLRPWLIDPDKLSQYDGIVVYRMDRLTRGDSKETRAIEDWADTNCKTLMTEDGLVFPCEGADGIRWDMAKRMSHEEWLKISERYERMKTSVRARGGYLGRVPFGFVLAPNELGAKVLSHGPDWPTTEALFRRATQYGLSDLSLWLEGETGHPWHESSILRILRNEAYRSDIPEFPHVQEILDARGAMGRGASGNREKALLSLLKCGNPDCTATGLERGPSPMRRINAKGTIYYRCMGREPRRRGCGNMIQLAKLDRLVLHGLDVWWTERHMIRERIPGDDVSVKIDELRKRLPHARDRAAVMALYDQIEEMEAKGSTPERWETRDSGMSEGEYLAQASLAEQRTFFALKDMRAWHVGPQIFVKVDGALARVGGRSTVGDLIAGA